MIQYIRDNRKKTIFVLILVLAAVIYFSYLKFFGSNNNDKYVLSQVKRETLVHSVSGTGQVVASNQVELSSKVSGTVSWVGFKAGDSVRVGSVIAKIGGVEAANAAFELENAKLALVKLVTPDSIELQKKENALTSATGNYDKALDSAFNTMLTSYDHFDSSISKLEALFNKDGYLYDVYISGRGRFSESVLSKISTAQINFYSAKKAYQTSRQKFSSFSRTSSDKQFEAALNDEFTSVQLVSQSMKEISDLLIYLKDREDDAFLTKVNSSIESVTALSSTASSDIANLIESKNSITSTKNSLAESKTALNDVRDGASDLDVRSQQLVVSQKEQMLANYSIVAPFDCVIGAVNIAQGSTVSNGSNIATVVTVQKVAKITLNEIDAAKISVGNTATLTFDALPEITASGTVVEIDAIGTANQGVVSYGAKISIDNQDQKIRPGMSVSVNIISDVKPNVIAVPSSAVKKGLRGSYVQVIEGVKNIGRGPISTDVKPVTKFVKVGESNDTLTEIISGLAEGDYVISRTINVNQTGSSDSINKSVINNSSRNTRRFIGGPGF